MTTGKILTLSSSQSTSQTLTIPNITGADTLAVLSLAQTLSNKYINLSAGTTLLDPLTFTIAGSAVLATPAAGAIETDTACFYTTVDTTNGRRINDNWNYFRLTGSGTGISTIADFFGATGSGIPLVTSGIYEIEWHCYFSQATAGTATWTIVSTNALQSLTGEYIGSPVAGIGAVGTPQTAGINVTASTSTAFPVTGSEANGATHYFVIHVMLQANATTGGNTRLRLTMSAGTATPLINSFFRVRHLSAGNTGTFVS